jgi:AraC-like DNA-binding protein
MTRSPERRCGRYEIEYYLTDAGLTYCDGESYPIRADHIQIARPGQKRHSQLPFNTMFLKFGVDEELEKLLDGAPAYFKATDPKRLRALFEEVISLKEAKASKLLLCAKVSELIDTVLQDAAVSETGGDTDVIGKAKRFMEQHYASPLSLSDICAAVNLSPTYFHTQFTKACGVTPHDYLADLRVAAAKKLLWSSDIPIALVAEQTGFANQQYFSKVFKAKTGTAPGAYRKSFRRRYFVE